MTDAANDPLQLTPLFQGGGEPWLPLLKPTIERLTDAPTFMGPGRAEAIVPVRELTFQALKPNPPERWKVVVFGQNPYPRVASATGIAMFDNAFADWKDGQFGKVTSIRCIIKAACMWRHAVKKQTSTAALRALLAEHGVVQPPEWFQAMLTQGVLLLNAALTVSSDDGLTTARHASFWRPVIERIIEGIFQAKRAAQDDAHRGVVFAWWGAHARALRGVVDRLQLRYPDVPVAHVDHCNPAAMGDAFCEGDHFGAVNDALASVGVTPIDWLPVAGWDQGDAQGAAGRMGEFIAATRELHALYLDRLQGVGEEKLEALTAIDGLSGLPPLTIGDAVAPLAALVPHLEHHVRKAGEVAQRTAPAAALTEHEVAALYLYTCESDLYRKLNATLRDPDRARVAPYRGYLRLFLSGLGKLQAHAQSLWRGVNLDLRRDYPEGRTVTWWGVSSCTSKLEVARSFLGSKGRRMLFEVRPRSAVSIRGFSAFTGEEEFVLPPGTQLRVVKVTTEATGLSVVELEELEGARLVS